MMTNLAEDVFQLLALPNQEEELINLDVAALLATNDAFDGNDSWLGDESNWLECFDFDDSENDIFLPVVKNEDDDVIGIDGAVCKLPRCLSLGSIASSEIGSVGSSTSTTTVDSTNRPIQPKPVAPKQQPVQQMRMVACKPPLVKALDLQDKQQPRKQQQPRRRSPISSANSTCSNTSNSTSTTSSGSNSEDDTSTDDGKQFKCLPTNKIIIARRLPSYGLSPKPVTCHMSHPPAKTRKSSHVTCHTANPVAPSQSVMPGPLKKAQPKLSVAEQRRVKRQEKMARNRELAAESRIRRKRLLEDLTKENELLRARLAALEGGFNLEGCQNSEDSKREGPQNAENSKRARIDDGLPMHVQSTSVNYREISIQTDESWLMQTTKLTTAAVGLALSAVLVAMDTSDTGTSGNGGNGTAFEVQLIAVWAMLAEFSRSIFGAGGNTIVPTLDQNFQHHRGHGLGNANGAIGGGVHVSDVRWLIWSALFGASLLIVVAVAGLAWMTKARKASMMYYEPEWKQINPWRKSQKCLG